MLAKKILSLMAEKGWSKRTAAQRCNIPYVSFVNITLGRRLKIWPETMQKLSKGFDVSLDELMEATQMNLDTAQIKNRLRRLDDSERLEIFQSLGLNKLESEIAIILSKKKYDRDSLLAFRTILERMSHHE